MSEIVKWNKVVVFVHLKEKVLKHGFLKDSRQKMLNWLTTVTKKRRVKTTFKQHNHEWETRIKPLICNAGEKSFLKVVFCSLTSYSSTA